MTDILKHFKSLPRRVLQGEIRRATGDLRLHLWEFIGLNGICTPVRAGKETALRLGIAEGTVFAYHVPEGGGHKTGCALGDLENVVAQPPPYPDPFA